MHVNLLPVSFVRRIALRQVAQKWGIAALVTLVAGGGMLGERYVALLAARQTERLSELQAKDVRLVQAEIVRMSAEANALQAEIARLQRARPKNYSLPLLGVASTSVRELAGKVQLKQLTAHISADNPSPAATGGAGNRSMAAATVAASPANDFILEGVAENAGVIAAFVDVLRGTHLFARVDLAATSETAGANGQVRQFRVNCRF